jgi:hypothetical protein
MQIKNGKDFWAGVMFMGFGLGFMIVARNYNMGTSVRMGPAYFPTVLGGMLAVLGLIIFVRSFASKITTSLRAFAFRPLVFAIGVALAIGTYFLKGSNEFVYQLALAVTLIALTAAWGPRSLYIVLSAVLVYAFVLKPLGLVLSILILVFISSYGGNEFKPKEVAILAVALAAFSITVFVYGLGLPFNVCPEALDDQCRALGISK